MPKIVNEENFEEEVIKSDLPVIADFNATWCGPCQMMHPVLEQLKAELGDSIRIIKVDVDKNEALSAQYRIQSVPTLMLFKDGEIKWRQSGAMMANDLKNVIEQLAMPVTVLSTDNYFNDISALINKYGSFDNLRDNGYDVDAPTSFQLDTLRSDLEDLSDGLDIKAPMYLPNGTGVSMPKAIDIPAQKIIVVEGIATMYESVKDVFDIKIYVETENELRKNRFMTRAVEERNQSTDNAEKHWNYIAQAGEKYVKPFRKEADLVINGNSDLKYFAHMLEYIYDITNNFQQ